MKEYLFSSTIPLYSFVIENKSPEILIALIFPSSSTALYTLP
jgi:hypothetical protein